MLAPGRLTVSYPLGKLRVFAQAIDVLGPLGAYRFERNGTVIEAVPPSLGFERFDIGADGVRVRIGVRHEEAVRSVLARDGWRQAST